MKGCGHVGGASKVNMVPLKLASVVMVARGEGTCLEGEREREREREKLSDIKPPLSFFFNAIMGEV